MQNNTNYNSITRYEDLLGEMNSADHVHVVSPLVVQELTCIRHIRVDMNEILKQIRKDCAESIKVVPEEDFHEEEVEFEERDSDFETSDSEGEDSLSTDLHCTGLETQAISDPIDDDNVAVDHQAVLDRKISKYRVNYAYTGFQTRNLRKHKDLGFVFLSFDAMALPLTVGFRQVSLEVTDRMKHNYALFTSEEYENQFKKIGFDSRRVEELYPCRLDDNGLFCFPKYSSMDKRLMKDPLLEVDMTLLGRYIDAPVEWWRTASRKQRYAMEMRRTLERRVINCGLLYQLFMRLYNDYLGPSTVFLLIRQRIVHVWEAIRVLIIEGPRQFLMLYSYDPVVQIAMNTLFYRGFFPLAMRGDKLVTLGYKFTAWDSLMVHSPFFEGEYPGIVCERVLSVCDLSQLVEFRLVSKWLMRYVDQKVQEYRGITQIRLQSFIRLNEQNLWLCDHHYVFDNGGFADNNPDDCPACRRIYDYNVSLYPKYDAFFSAHGDDIVVGFRELPSLYRFLFQYEILFPTLVEFVGSISFREMYGVGKRIFSAAQMALYFLSLGYIWRQGLVLAEGVVSEIISRFSARGSLMSDKDIFHARLYWHKRKDATEVIDGNKKRKVNELVALAFQ